MYKKSNKLVINIDPLRSGQKSNIAGNIINFIDSLSYDGFILAGNSVANIIENINIRGDLDFWVLQKEKYMDVLEEFQRKGPILYDVYPSMIELVFENLPIVNLILSDMSIGQTVNSFDFDYCRCYYTQESGCVASEICLVSIFTKTICAENAYGNIRPSRILKAIRYGYSFNRKFWFFMQHLVKNKQKLECNICRINKIHKRYCYKYMCDHFFDIPLSIRNDDLDLTKFEQNSFNISVTNPTNIDNSIDELEKIFRRNGDMRDMFRLPKLFSFTEKDFGLVKIYVSKIIMFNPVRNGNYMQINLKNGKILRKISIKKQSDEEDNREFSKDDESIEENDSKLVEEDDSKSVEEDDSKLVEEEDDSKSVEEDDSKSVEEDDSESCEDYSSSSNTSNRILNYDPINDTNDEKIIYLNTSKTSYLKIKYLPDNLKNYATENFNEMFDLHPETKHKIIMFLKEVEVHRWQQSYLNTPQYKIDTLKKQSYMYSGFDTSNNHIELPYHFQLYYDYMKTMDNKFNQVIANWYQDNNDYISHHSDCEIGMIPNAEIAIISLYEKTIDDSTNYRIFSLIPNNKKINYLDYEYDRINVVARHGTIITMCGNTQKEFKHGIEKTNRNVSRRISISFRQFKK